MSTTPKPSSEQCVVDGFSSRVCERGTKSCEVQHAKPSEHAMRAATRLFSRGGVLLVGMGALEIDQHAIAPAVAERDQRIAELEEVLRDVDEVTTTLGWHTDRGTLSRVRAILAKSANPGGAHE